MALGLVTRWHPFLALMLYNLELKPLLYHTHTHSLIKK
jgi:hypothetical protein